MDNSFRFVALRAPDRTPPKHSTDLRSDSKFQQALAGIRNARKDGSSFPTEGRQSVGL